MFVLLAGITIFATHTALPQGNRIPYNGQQLYLSGANLAWLSFANDIGDGDMNYDAFADILLQMHDHGGNTLRWWLHTNGSASPQFNDSARVTGPGQHTIADLRTALDLAWEREISLKLCLWSFDMLRSSNSATILNRNTLLLTDTAYTHAYIRNCLIPMVDSLRGHPAILAWEIFNEPEGMSDEFGWSEIQHVPMSAIQRFVNLCAGAIHRTDTAALVTSGSWSFYALTDVPTAASALGNAGTELAQLTSADYQDMESRFAGKYGFRLTAAEIFDHMQIAADRAGVNYYTDARLIAAGGDPDGTLDFYSVHYYDWGGTAISPFHHPKAYWGLDKALVVAEFAMKNTFGVPKDILFDTLYQTGYAGALPWSWTDQAFSSAADMLAGMQQMWDRHRADVDVLGIGGDWPTVSITSPDSGAKFPDTASVNIVAEAHDSDGLVVLVEFYANSTKIGERTAGPFSMIWSGIPPNMYTLKAVATDNQGHIRMSKGVPIVVGTPAMTRLEAEGAVLAGTPTRRSDPTASRGTYVTMQQTGTITWTLPSVPAAGTYDIIFGFRLPYDHPKTQYLNVNGVRAGELVFDGPLNTWLEKQASATLIPGSNVLQVELSWGWMDLDYMAVPTQIVTSVTELPPGLPTAFGLDQNYPNPFNPTTTIRYRLPVDSHVTLAVFDLLGREVARLVNDKKPAGYHQAEFRAIGLSSGVYVYRLNAGNFVETKRSVLLR